MKVGDIIARKDMPQLKCKIVGEQNKGKWGDIWYVEEMWVSPFKEDRKRRKRGGFIYKDDERWFVVKQNANLEAK